MKRDENRLAEEYWRMHKAPESLATKNRDFLPTHECQHSQYAFARHETYIIEKTINHILDDTIFIEYRSTIIEQ